MAAVFGRYGTAPRSFGATFWNPGVKTEKTAKKRRKNEQNWARYGLTKRVRVADLFVMDRYASVVAEITKTLAEQMHSVNNTFVRDFPRRCCARRLAVSR